CAARRLLARRRRALAAAAIRAPSLRAHARPSLRRVRAPPAQLVAGQRRADPRSRRAGLLVRAAVGHVRSRRLRDPRRERHARTADAVTLAPPRRRRARSPRSLRVGAFGGPGDAAGAVAPPL